MEPKVLKALRGSIAKWEKIVLGTGYDAGSDNCPLCQIFNRDEMEGKDCCIGCPVMKKTRKRWCEGTPYHAFADMVGKTSPTTISTGTLAWHYRAVTSEQIRAAAKMLIFLQSLLPNSASLRRG
jgi:hypothetical protein